MCVYSNNIHSIKIAKKAKQIISYNSMMERLANVRDINSESPRNVKGIKRTDNSFFCLVYFTRFI